MAYVDLTPFNQYRSTTSEKCETTSIANVGGMKGIAACLFGSCNPRNVPNKSRVRTDGVSELASTSVRKVGKSTKHKSRRSIAQKPIPKNKHMHGQTTSSSSNGVVTNANSTQYKSRHRQQKHISKKRKRSRRSEGDSSSSSSSNGRGHENIRVSSSRRKHRKNRNNKEKTSTGANCSSGSGRTHNQRTSRRRNTENVTTSDTNVLSNSTSHYRMRKCNGPVLNNIPAHKRTNCLNQITKSRPIHPGNVIDSSPSSSQSPVTSNNDKNKVSSQTQNQRYVEFIFISVI